MEIELDDPIFIVIGSILVIIAFYFIIWPRVTLKHLPFATGIAGPSGEFYKYVRRWLSWISLVALFAILIWALVLYKDLTTEKITLWLAGSAGIILLILTKFPEAENAIAALTVFFRHQVEIGQEFEITLPNGKKKQATLHHRNERFTYARDFDDRRSLIELPHTVWVQSIISNLSNQPIRWAVHLPLRFPMKKRDAILDIVDEFVVESEFSDVPPSAVEFNYQTKLMPEIWGHLPEQVLTVYTMVSNREHAFNSENAFLDGLYKALSGLSDVKVAQGAE
tara:strand:+ start:4364 stop:5203 length:840 start_codon:yes stop_codon:yes gene_type:complete